MSDDSYDRMMAALRDGSGAVVLDTEAPHVSASAAAASAMARDRMERINKGERVAWLYPADHAGVFQPSTDQDWHLCTGVSSDQARQLIAAGAKWIGAEFYKP